MVKSCDGMLTTTLAVISDICCAPDAENPHKWKLAQFCDKVSCDYLMLGKEMVTIIFMWIIFAVLVTISVQLSNVTKLLRSINAKNDETRPS